MVGMHARSKIASERPDMHACMPSCRQFVSSFMQAASGQSPVPSHPFASQGGSIYIRVSISSGLVGKTKQTLVLVEDPRPVLLRARNRWRVGASGPDVLRELCSGVRQFGFWGAFTRLPTSTTTTSPDSLQRLRCYDDMADPSSSSIAAAGYRSLSPLFIYLFCFLLVLQYACLDVLQSSFKYACLECVTFKISICVYVIIMSNNF
jgi:hypothetical protein